MLENFTRDYRAIDKPFAKCPNCNQIVKYDHIFEWDTKSFFGKIAYIGILLFTSILYGGALPLIYILVSEFFKFKSSEKTFILLYLLGFSLCGIWIIYQAIKDIRKSRERLKNPDYQELLKEMGFKIYN